MKSWGINIKDTNSDCSNLFLGWWIWVSGINSFFFSSWSFSKLDVEWRIVSFSNLISFIDGGWVVEFLGHGDALGISFNAFTEWSSEWGNLSESLFSFLISDECL